LESAIEWRVVNFDLQPLVASTIVPQAVFGEARMDRRKIEEFIQANYRSRRAGDLDAVLKHFHREAEFRIAGSDALKPFTQSIRGEANLRKTFAEMFPTWDWSKFHIQSVHVDGDTAFVHSSGELRHTPSGKLMHTEILDRIRFKDDLIIDLTEFVDTHLVSEVLGMA
jgi:ketosteroid isomerase-like protein